MLNKALNLYITGKEKAVVGSWVAGVAVFLLQHFGWHTSNATQQVAVAAVVLAITHLAVYLEKNTKVKKVVTEVDQQMDSFPTTSTATVTTSFVPPVTPSALSTETDEPQISANPQS